LSLNNKLENIKQQKEQLKISMKNIENQKVKLNEINSEINVINSITRSSWGEKLLQINSKIVDGVFLSHVELKGNILSLKGFSYEFVSIGVLLNGIKNLYFIKLAELDSVIKTDSYGNEYFAFNILCKVE
jgi:Tfp pilus assembly protein PilN